MRSNFAENGVHANRSRHAREGVNSLRAGQGVDKDGHHDCLCGGVTVATSFDLGAGMTYDGHIAANPPGSQRG